jgi:hypothetical protein
MCATKAASVESSCDSASGLMGEDENTVLVLRCAAWTDVSMFIFAYLDMLLAAWRRCLKLRVGVERGFLRLNVEELFLCIKSFYVGDLQAALKMVDGVLERLGTFHSLSSFFCPRLPFVALSLQVVQ